MTDSEILTSARRALRAFHVPTNQYRLYYAFARQFAALESTGDRFADMRRAGDLGRLWARRGLDREVLACIRMLLVMSGIRRKKTGNRAGCQEQMI